LTPPSSVRREIRPACAPDRKAPQRRPAPFPTGRVNAHRLRARGLPRWSRSRSILCTLRRRIRDGGRNHKSPADPHSSLPPPRSLSLRSLYIPYILTAALVAATACLLPPQETLSAQYLDKPPASVLADLLTAIAALWASIARVWYAYAVFAFAIYYGLTSKPSVYLMDFAVYEPPQDWQVSRADLCDLLERHGCYSAASLEFMAKLLANSGTGDATHWPPTTVRMIRKNITSENYTPRVANADAADVSPTKKGVETPSSSSSSGGGKRKDAKGSAAAAAPAVSSTPVPSTPTRSKMLTGVPGATATPSRPSVTERASTTAEGKHALGPDGLHLYPDRSMEAARACAETVLCTVFADLLARTGVKAKSIDFLIVNCSLFCPTPSLTSIVARRFGLRSTVRTYNLGGMGCSASVIAIDLAKQLLQNRSNSTAVILSTEEISQNLYLGNRRDMLLQNTLFRVGGGAVLLSNKLADGFRAKYKLLHTVRAQDMSEEAREAVYQCEDDNGTRGISLSRKITDVAGRALKDNLTILGPQILPVREQAKVLFSMARRRLVPVVNGVADRLGLARIPFCGTESGRLEKNPVYVPDFKRAVDHFCIHAGGRAVIDGIEGA
jgi:hypothetical protein